MFDRTPNARVAGGGRVGQNASMAYAQPTPGGPVWSCGTDPANCSAGVQRTFLGADSVDRATVPGIVMPTQIPGTTTNVSTAANTGNFWTIPPIVATAATQSYFIGTFTPRCPVKALALYINSLTVTVGVEIIGLFIGMNGAQNNVNLMMMNGQLGGAIPADAFADLNACVPLLDVDQCATPQCPFILVGRTMLNQNAAVTTTAHIVRASLIVERCG